MRKLPIILGLIAVAAAFAVPAQAASTVRVSEVDYRIVLSSKPRAGKVTVWSGTRAVTTTTSGSGAPG